MPFTKLTRYIGWLPGGLILLAGILGLPHCAKVVSPTGGDKDTIPPVVRKTLPENFSLRFNSKYFEVSFDEFIQLKEVNQKLIVSPPLKNKPEVRLRGKTIRVSIDEELLENTTYTFNFNDAIVDNNEGNPLEGFEYVFSTGDELDSLSIRGRVLNSFSLKPEEGVYAMLYRNLNDSAPYLQVPYYLGKTGKDGTFRIDHLDAGTYRLFALKDMNMNYMFDQLTEPIAFHDSLIVLPFDQPVITDTLETDSLFLPAETLRTPEFVLRLFTGEVPVKQYISSTGRPQKNQMQMTFSRPQDSLPSARIMEHIDTLDLFISEPSAGRDTLIYWIKDSVLMDQEIIVMAVEYVAEDSAGAQVPVTDTLTFRYTAPSRGRRPDRETPAGKPALTLNSLTGDKGIQELNVPLLIETGMPVIEIDTSRLRFVWVPDSVEQMVKFTLERDSCRMRWFKIRCEWEPGAKYYLQILPGAFTGYLGNTNDTLSLGFTTRKNDYYGTLYMNISAADRPVIIQMLGKDDKVIRENRLREDTGLGFLYLAPDKYRFRAIWDINENGKWDTGKYLEGKQPEEVILFEEEVNVRSNWEIELGWILKFENGIGD